MKAVFFLTLLLSIQVCFGIITAAGFVNEGRADHVSSSRTRSVVAYTDDPSIMTGWNYMTIYDITDPENPCKGYTFHQSTMYSDLTYAQPTVVHNLLFYSVAPNIYIYDITNIHRPVMLYNLYIYNCYCFCVYDNLLLLGMLDGSIRFYDFGDLSNIHYEGIFYYYPTIWNMYNSGGKLIISCGQYLTRYIKTGDFDPQTLSFSETNSVDLLETDKYVGMMGTNLVIHTSSGQLLIYDCSSAGSTTQIYGSASSAQFSSVVTDGEYLYSTTGNNFVSAWTINSQNQLQILNSYYHTSFETAGCQVFQVSDKLLSCRFTGWGNGFYYLDVSDPAPQSNLISHFNNTADFSNMAFLDSGPGYIYYNFGQALALLRINDDHSLEQFSVMNDLTGLRGLSVRNHYLYAHTSYYSDRTIKTYDCSVPAQPQLISQVTGIAGAVYKPDGDVIYSGAWDNVTKYRLNENAVPVPEANISYYLTQGNQSAFMRIVDITAYQDGDYAVGYWYPNYYAYPYLLGWTSAADSVCVLQISRYQKLFARDGHIYTLGKGICTYSLDQDDGPVQLNYSLWSLLYSNAACLTSYLDRYLLVSYSSSNCIAVFDLIDPDQPCLVRKIRTSYPALTMFVKDDKLFTGNGKLGVAVYDLSGLTPISDDNHTPVAADIRVSPNPFTGQVKIAFELKQPGPAKTTIFNVKGQVVREITSAEVKDGKVELVWDGKDNTNRDCAAGVYFIRVNSSSPLKVRKILKLK